VKSYERLGEVRLPWSTERPLVFHVLTSLPWGDPGRAPFRRLLDEGASLQPPRARRGSWGGEDTHLGGIDADAGDDRALFLTPLRPHKDNGFRRNQARPAVAFGLEALLGAAPVGWRPCDLIGLYQEVFGLEPYSDDLHAAAPRLREVAACFTATGPDDVRALVRGEAQHLAGRPYEAGPVIARLDAAAQRNCRAALAGVQFPPWFQYPFLSLDELAGHHADLAVFPGSLLRGRRVPEVLVYGAVPLREASFWRDPGDGVWHGVGR
jgi:hypothetical protein